MSVRRVLAVVAVALAASPSNAAAAGTSAEQLTLRLPERVPLNWYDTWRGLRVVLSGLEPRPALTPSPLPFDY